MTTMRERNNLARRQHYQRQKEQSEWLAFEYFALKHHAETYGHHVWHTSTIPEDELFNAGVIHDFNKHRLKRLAMKREAEGKPLKYSDYGMDFLAKETTPDGDVYHACQAKHYLSRKVSGNDLGTFFLVLLSQIKQTGYLYTTGDLEVNLKENLKNTDQRVVHHQIPFETSGKLIIKDETKLPLRAYQQEAIKTVIGKGKKVIEIACGLGKTLIAAHVLKQSPQYKRIICVAPLCVSVEQLRDRIGAFLPSYEKLLVDSDAGGTTDVDVVHERFNTGKPVVMFTTFKSFEENLAPILTGDEYLIVDEVHNAVQRPSLCETFNTFKNALFMSATIPEEMYEVLDADKVFSYGLADGIKNGFICDYEVLLPAITYNEELKTKQVDVDVPEPLTGDLSAKALFLATGMLRTGSKRCIVYMRNCAECDVFIDVFQKVMDSYHGLNVWCDKIDQSVSGKNRKRILDEFQSDDEYDMHVITSVRILDEAVDVPRCDSEFITCVGDATSDIRTVQRLQRGGRLDHQNPSKKNHLFLWAEDWAPAIGALTLLKDADPNFKVKLRVLDGNYDRGDNGNINIQCEDLRSYVEVQCLTMKERWEMRRQEWIAMYDKLGRRPMQSHDDFAERSIAQWASDMRRHNGKRLLCSEEQKMILTATPRWFWNSEDARFHDNFEKWKYEVSRLNRRPKNNEDDQDERSAYFWFRGARMNFRHNLLSDIQIEMVSVHPNWSWEDADSFAIQYENWTKQYNKLGKHPSCHSKNKDEKKAGKWGLHMRQANKGHQDRNLSKERFEILSNTPGWVWEFPDTFTEQYNKWVSFYEKNGYAPRHVGDEEARSARWRAGLRATRKGIKTNLILTEEQEQILTNTPGWTW